MSEGIAVDNNEIEVACDLLWFVKLKGGLSGFGEVLWERLQPIRHGDYGGTASTSLSFDEARIVVAAGEFAESEIHLDADEAARVARLRRSLPS